MTSATPQNTETQTEENDPVNKPAHYRSHPSGIECIQVTEHMSFNIGNAIKYLWRCDLKKDSIEDLKKSVWYIQREISKREREAEAKKTVTGAFLRTRSDSRGTTIGTAHVNVIAVDPIETAKTTAEAIQRSFNGGNS